MLKWLYRVLFAPRATWCLYHRQSGGSFRLTVYYPEPDDFADGHETARGLVADGWELVSAPREGSGD